MAFDWPVMIFLNAFSNCFPLSSASAFLAASMNSARCSSGVKGFNFLAGIYDF
jgi:hypothetical protein